MEIIATHQCNLSEARLGRDSSILLPLVWPRFHGRGIVCTQAAVQNRHRKACRCRQTFLWICFWRLRTETMRRRRQHPFVPLTVCDWDLVTESHSSRGRVRNGSNDRFSKRNLTAVVTTHKGDPLLLLNPPPKSLSCGFPRRSVGKYDQVYVPLPDGS